jgi:hypothetical protein
LNLERETGFEPATSTLASDGFSRYVSATTVAIVICWDNDFRQLIKRQLGKGGRIQYPMACGERTQDIRIVYAGNTGFGYRDH